MSIQARRTEKGWSQEDLALHTGLSVRTIQRIEAGRKPGLESLKCLAAVFETTVIELIEEQNVKHEPNETRTGERTEAADRHAQNREREAIEYVQNLKAFHLHWISFIFVVPGLYIVNSTVSPMIMWMYWVAAIWGGAILLHAIVLFGLFGVFGANWEQRQFQRRMSRQER